MDLKSRLSKKERDELEALMEAHDPSFTGPMQGSITCVHGFLTSVISGPIVMPSEWMPMVFGDEADGAWETMEQAQRAMSLVMRLYNDIASDLGPGGRRYSILIDRIGDRPDTLDLADDWCKGYALGIAMREDEWNEAMESPELEETLFPILALAHPEKPTQLDPIDNPENYAAVLDVLPKSAIEIHGWWRKQFASSLPASDQMRSGTVRRATPKVSANSPCPCGSGKKYKRCCSSLRTA